MDKHVQIMHILIMDMSIFLAPFEQLWNSPASAFIIVPVSIVAWLWEMWDFTPSKYVPLVCIILGTALYPALTPLKTVPPNFPIPILVLILNGLVLGFLAFILHKFLVKKLIEKFSPLQVAAKQDKQDAKDNTPPTP